MNRSTRVLLGVLMGRTSAQRGSQCVAQVLGVVVRPCRVQSLGCLVKLILGPGRSYLSGDDERMLCDGESLVGLFDTGVRDGESRKAQAEVAPEGRVPLSESLLKAA